MKLSDYLALFFIQTGCTHVFGYQGGAVTHIIDSLYKYKENIRFVGCCHEQAAAFAAEGYARTRGGIGVAIATSGPGATNLITGIGSAYFDSIPCLYITGQVNTYEYKDSLSIRQLGFQETDIVSIVGPITKHALRLTDPQRIRYELEKAVFIAMSGRKGPVLLDIPMDVQRAELNEESLAGYEADTAKEPPVDMEPVIERLNRSRRPVILAGGGVRLAGAAEALNELVRRLKIPVVCSLMGRDAVDNALDEYIGMIGAYGNRYANLTAANSDLVLAVGTRLDTRQTGTLPKSFAREADLIRVDIDQNELDRRVKPTELSIRADAKVFLDMLNADAGRIRAPDSAWLRTVRDYKQRYPSCSVNNFTDPNYIMRTLGRLTGDGDILCLDVGQNQMWGAQSLCVTGGQRLLTSGGMGAMGFSLPCAVGAYYAGLNRTVYAFTGDGGMQMNIQELTVLKRCRIPVKVIILNNRSLGMIRHFQEMYFGSRYCATVEDYEAPDFCAIAQAYGIDSLRMENEQGLQAAIPLLRSDRPAVLEIMLAQHTYVFPKLSVNHPVEEQEPPLARDEFLSNMIAAPFDGTAAE